MKTKKISKAILLLAICLCANFTFGQPPTTPYWAKVYNSSGTQKDLGYAITTDASGNSYVTGYADVNGDPKLTTIKYTSAGTATWTTTSNTTYTGSCKVEAGLDIIYDGTYVWVSGVTYNGGTNYSDITLIKYLASTGAIQTNYPKTYSDVGCNADGLYSQGSCVTYFADGTGTHVYVGGSSYNSSGTLWNFIVLKDNPSTSGWSWTYLKAGSNNSSTAESRATDLKADGSNVYATGWISNTSNGRDIWTTKIAASNGSQTWGTQFSGTANDDAGNALGVDGSGNVYVAGYKGTGTSNKDAVLIKYDGTNGTQMGTVTYSNSANGNDSWTDIVVVGTSTVAPAVYVGGYVTTNTTTANTDYALGAYTATVTLANGASYWNTADPVTYDGAYTGAEAAGTDQGHAIEYSTTSGKVYITGMSSECSAANCSTAVNINITTIGYNGTTGAKVWGATSYDYNTDTYAFREDEMYNKYGLAVRWDLTYCVDNIYVEGDSYDGGGPGYDYTTLKYACPGTGCVNCLGPGHRMMNTSATSLEASELYPNPFTKTAELRLAPETQISNGILSVYDATGRLVTTIQNITSTTIIIDRGNLSKGLYFYTVSDNGNMITNGKFIITD